MQLCKSFNRINNKFVSLTKRGSLTPQPIEDLALLKFVFGFAFGGVGGAWRLDHNIKEESQLHKPSVSRTS